MINAPQMMEAAMILIRLVCKFNICTILQIMCYACTAFYNCIFLWMVIRIFIVTMYICIYVISIYAVLSSVFILGYVAILRVKKYI